MSRYFKVVYDDFTDFGDELERNHSYWQERVEALASLFEKFLPDSFQGETADSINLYFNEVHGYILAGLYELMEISKRNFLMYKNDYYELIDSSLHAVISEYELEHIADTMKRYKLELEDYHYELKQTLNSVSDIVRIKEPSAEDLYDDYEAVIKYVEKLRDDILDLEAKHKREDFVEFNEVKARLTSFMDEVSSKGRSFKENYQTKAVSGLDSFADYNTALMAGYSYIESTQERYEKALAAEAIRIEKLKAEQRIVDGIVRVVASVAVVAGIIILSGGTLAPAAIPTVIFAYGELTEGANDIYLGLEGDGSSIAFNSIRDTIFLGNQLTYDIAAFGLDIGVAKFSKPTITNLNQVVKYGAKSTTSGSTSRIRNLTKKFLGKADDVGDVKKGEKAVGKGSLSTKGYSNFADGMTPGDATIYNDWVDLRETGLDQTKINDIILTNKGYRPDPTTYLNQKYIDAHLTQFDDGVSVIQTEWAYSRYSETNGFVGVPDDNSLFVMPKKYCDDVISKSNGNISIIEKDLGFPKGYFSDGGGLVRIDINDISNLNIRIPSGNETGANKLWVPGGRTSGGVPEAVTNIISLKETTVTRIHID